MKPTLLALIKQFVLILMTQAVDSASPPGAASSVFRGKQGQGQGQGQSKIDLNQPFDPINYDKMNYYDSTVPVPDEQNLIMKLLRNYDPAARPVFNASTSVVIKFGFALIQICDMDERNQVFTTNVWLEQVRMIQ
jgi:hypothetical protein